jgi:hypothetical protein
VVVVKEVDGTILRNDNIKLLVGAPERARFSDDDLPAKAHALFFGQQCAEILVAPHLLIPVAAVLLLVVVVITSSTKNDRRARRDDDDADRVVGV